MNCTEKKSMERKMGHFGTAFYVERRERKPPSFLDAVGQLLLARQEKLLKTACMADAASISSAAHLRKGVRENFCLLFCFDGRCKDASLRSDGDYLKWNFFTAFLYGPYGGIGDFLAAGNAHFDHHQRGDRIIVKNRDEFFGIINRIKFWTGDQGNSA